jgi:hypothetical protein
VIDAIPWNKFPRLTAMLKKVTKKEKSSSLWNIITKPNKVTKLDNLNNKKKR